MKALPVASLFAFLCCGCHDSKENSPVASSRDHELPLVGTNMTSGELAKLIGSIRPWSVVHPYDTADWAKLVGVARVFQRVGTLKAVGALDVFRAQSNDRWQEDYFEDSKAFLLLRVIFDLPQHADPKERIASGWTTFDLDLNSDGSANLGWPIGWTNHTPYFIPMPIILYHGPPYDPKREYETFAQRFKKRDLDRVVDIDRIIP